MVSIYASLGSKGIDIVKHVGSDALQRSVIRTPKQGKSFYQYADDVIDSYPKDFKKIIADLQYGEIPKGIGVLVKSAGQRVLPNGDVYLFTRNADQNGIEWVCAQVYRAGKLLCSKEKYFMDGLAIRQDKVSYFPQHKVNHEFFNRMV